ncbi:MAG TPA: hypothetical protein VFU15_12915 [Bacteroidia bacterium]|nr:hypothetical protein [Bacteroidia bacterium]
MDINPFQPFSPAKRSPLALIKGICFPLSLVFYLLALMSHAYSDGTYGITCAAMGWSIILTGNLLAFIAWFSNIPFWTAFFMFVISRKKNVHMTAFWLSAVALLFSMGAFAVHEVMENEGGMSHMVEIAGGAYTWMASYAILLTGTILSTTTLKKVENEKKEKLLREKEAAPANPWDEKRR